MTRDAMSNMSQNEVLFKGRAASTEGVVHAMEGSMTSWFPLARHEEVKD